MQILVNYQNQGQFQNLQVLRIPKLSLKVKFDEDLTEKIKVKDKKINFKIIFDIRLYLVPLFSQSNLGQI